MIQQICEHERVDPKGLVLHSDNGKPMRGSTMLATLQWLGIVPSTSTLPAHGALASSPGTTPTIDTARSAS